MSWDEDINIYDDPIVFLSRKGDAKNPYKYIKETVQVVNGKAVLRESPEKTYKVKVTGKNKVWYEMEEDELEDNYFQVDYVHGVVYFTSTNNGLSLTFEYYGKGAYLTPDTKVYLSKDSEFTTVADKFKDLDRKDEEQKVRVDNLLINNPQPSEVVDMRVDRNGKVYRVAREYLNMLQKYIEDSFTAKDGEKFSSLKDRLLEIEKDIATSEESSKDYVDSIKTLIDIEFSDMDDAIEKVKQDLIGLIENTAFDITKLNPRYIIGFGGIRNAVNQSINIDSKTMNIYTTQSDSLTPEGFYINKLSPSGKYVSSMWIKEGGHGTMIAVDHKTVSGKVIIWFFHNALKKMLRYEYKDNYVLNLSEANSLSDYTPCGLREKYFTPSYDEYFDYMCFRREDGIVEIRKRSDVVNKIDNVLYSVTIDASEYTSERPMQGCVSYGSDIYYQS
ncbi:MAG: hypothetical protein ABTA16_19365, partial [Niallia sp.]